jgi:hypothetical protein
MDGNQRQHKLEANPAPHPELSPVTSSNIEAVGHEGTTLYVRFKGGAVWSYANVMPASHQEMMAQESIGGYFAKHIKPNAHHKATKVSG